MKPVKITSKEYYHHKGKVYDLEVADIHSYNIDGLVVHNSGGGSVVNNLLGITKIDPIKHGLIFERFLNQDRGHLPDIDSDVDYKRGPEIFQYLIDKYGREYVANVCTFSRLQTKVVIKDIAKVLGIPYEEVNAFTKNIPDRNEHGELLNGIAELKELNDPKIQEFIHKYPKLIKYAEILEGSPRHASQHPAGIAVSPIPITDLIPVMQGKPTSEDAEPGYLSQFEKDNFEQSGLVKIDILKLNATSQVDAMLKLIKQYYPEQANTLFKGKEINSENIPLDDFKTYELLRNLDVAGIFQMDNANISIPVLRKVQPTNIDELSAITSLIRPGSSGLDEYCQVKSGKKEQIKIDPRIDKILKPTYGAILYQETIMSLISTILGISFGQADIYRRAIEKPKKFPEKYQEFQDNFVSEGIKNGFTPKVIQYVQQAIIDNSGYSFNQSHAYAYSYITAQMAFIKAHFPLAFYAAMIDDDLTQIATYLNETKKKGIIIYPPDASLSQEHTTIGSVEKNAIRIGLNAIKGIGESAFSVIMENQPFTSINDFIRRCSGRAVNKKTILALINNDAFFNTPFKFNDELLKNTSLENHKDLILNRTQLRTWYLQYYQYSHSAAEPNYLVPQELLTNDILDNINNEFVFEKDNSLIVPESALSRVGINDINLVKTTSKRPKGILLKSKADAFFKPFITHYNEIVNAENSRVDSYIEDLKNNEFSLIDFPYPKADNSVVDRILTENIIVGLIKNKLEFTSKNDKKCLRLEIITRDETIIQFLFENEYSTCINGLNIWDFIFYTGIPNKTYGGLNQRSPIYNARKIIELGNAVILKDYGELTNEQKYIDMMNKYTNTNQLNIGTFANYINILKINSYTPTNMDPDLLIR